ncbi:hypothetical protein [Algoriphagus namhaensis]
MLSFFKVNDPFRLLGVVFYLILLSLVYLLLDPFGLTQSQLSWLVAGERAAMGYLPFHDIIDDSGALSVAVFGSLDYFFGRNILVYELLGRGIILWQAIYWNVILIRFRVFDEVSYLPAMVVVALFHFSFDMLSLSPALMGSCFLLLALGQLISLTVLQKESSESTLLIGLYTGLAVGFHSVFIVFLPYLIFAGIVISGFSFRELLLSLAGFILPILAIGTFYFWNDGLWNLIDIWPLSFLTPRTAYQSLSSWAILSIFVVGLAILGYFFCAVLRGSTINQQKQRQLLITWLFISSLELFLIKDQAGFQLVVLIPTLGYLITQFFHFFKRALPSNLLFLLLTLVFPVICGWYWVIYLEKNPNYLIQEDKPIETEGGVMALQNDLSPLSNSYLDGPFLNYEMTRLFLKREKSYRQKARLFQLLETQKSAKVLDPNGEFEELLRQFPVLEEDYSKSGPGEFELK